MTNRNNSLISDRAGIILAGGLGTRLSPCTDVIPKHLLPVYDKPMIMYPVSTMVSAGVHDIMIICSSQRNLELTRDLLDMQVRDEVKISYIVQANPDGLSQAYTIADDWLNGRPSMMLLGDNIFIDTISDSRFAPNFLNITKVADPTEYGVVEFGEDRIIKSVVEKPFNPPSQWVVTGAYFFDHDAPKFASELKKSMRGQYEITDLINLYIERKHVCHNRLHRGWFDCGTPDRLVEAASFIQAWQKRTGDLIGGYY